MERNDVIENGGLADSEAMRPHLSGPGYSRLRRSVVLATATVSLVPLIIMTVITYYQYERTFHSEAVQGINRTTSNNKRALEFFVTERRSALDYIIRDRSFEELCDATVLGQVIRNMNRAFATGAFVDLGLIDSNGKQVCYSGPFRLEGRDYSGQDWFHQVSRRGVFTSDVFLGYRNSPHFAIATRHETSDDDYYVLRATIDAEMLSEQILASGLTPDDDIFVVNRRGVLQTPSRRYGNVLESVPLHVPPVSSSVEVLELRDEKGKNVSVGYAYIEDSPFVLMYVRPPWSGTSKWLSLTARLGAFLAVSAALILGVVLWGSRQFVNNIRAMSLRRAALMHKVEYSNKLASIGRLAAGVAHEINNPLAIINEKAGLLKDLVTLSEDFPRREKILGLVDSVLGSVDRCKTITHRLLGFAKHMDIQHEAIDVPSLLREVVGFLGKEAEYRNVSIVFDSVDNVPTIESDRGQLQQVFLNILNNAMAAVAEGGRIDISVGVVDDEAVTIGVVDNGVGIPRENLERIFEPFFSTKGRGGTGLGLSITYGIVEKLGGQVSVQSEVGRGTKFTVRLPITRGE